MGERNKKTHCNFHQQKPAGSPWIPEEFEVRVDGIVSEEKQLIGKPEPDPFLNACEQLGSWENAWIWPCDSVARDRKQEELLNSGADFVVSSQEDIE